MKKKDFIIYFCGSCLSVCPSVARANAIIPYLFVPVSQLFMLPFIIIFESYIIERRIKKEIGSGRIFLATSVANLASTAIGAAIYFATMPLVGDLMWEIWNTFHTPASFSLSLLVTLVLLGVSIYSESWVITRLIPSLERKRLRAYPNINILIFL